MCWSMVLWLLVGVSHLWGQESNLPTDTGGPQARKYSNEFLKIGVGARAFGMGNAQTAVSEDVSGGYWNPAALAHEAALHQPELAIMHASYFANIASYHWLGFTTPVDSAGDRRFGATLIRFGIDDIPNTLSLVEPDGTIRYDRIESFSVTDFAAILSYAWRVRKVQGLHFGVNMKIIYRGIGRFANAWGFGLDVGAHYQRERFRAGLVLLDATNTINAWTFNSATFGQAFINTGNAIPENSLELTRPTIRLGLAYDFRLGRRMSLLASLDNDIYTDGARPFALISTGAFTLDPRAGLELAYLDANYRKVAFLRGGAYNLQNVVNNDAEEALGLFPTAGVGVVIKNFQLDYALANIGNFSENLYSHVVSLKFHIE